MLTLMLNMLALTLLISIDAFQAAAYAIVDSANADAKMPNLACHLVGAYGVVLTLPLLPFNCNVVL